MQTQTMSKVPPSQPSILPPLQNLPSWSRSSLERRKQPRPIERDQLANISIEGNEKDFEMTQDKTKNLKPSGDGLRTISAPYREGDGELNQRVVQMEKSLEFVQGEHAQVLENLHKEIERLKTENKELNFKLVMSKSGVNLEETSPVPSEEITEKRIKTPVKETKEKEPKPEKLLESENTKKESTKSTAIETKNNSRNSATLNSKKRAPSGKNAVTCTPPSSGKKTGTQHGSGKSNFLTKARTRQPQKDKQEATHSNSPVNSRTESIRYTTPQSPVWSAVHGGQQMLIVTLNKDKSMQVHEPTENGPRSPTLSECKTIIAEQQETNHKQAKELLKLRADLREAITSQKWNQNSYIVGKSFGKMEAASSSSADVTHVSRHLPRLPFREPISGRLQSRAPVAPEKVSLPALRPNINSVVADRRRRQQAILRGRMGRKDFC